VTKGRVKVGEGFIFAVSSQICSRLGGCDAASNMSSM
jgi:hypothetical protein